MMKFICYLIFCTGTVPVYTVYVFECLDLLGPLLLIRFRILLVCNVIHLVFDDKSLFCYYFFIFKCGSWIWILVKIKSWIQIPIKWIRFGNSTARFVIFNWYAVRCGSASFGTPLPTNRTSHCVTELDFVPVPDSGSKKMYMPVMRYSPV